MSPCMSVCVGVCACGGEIVFETQWSRCLTLQPNSRDPKEGVRGAASNFGLDEGGHGFTALLWCLHRKTKNRKKQTGP